MLELYHDKASWADNTDIMGQAAADAIGVGFASVPFPDTTTYQSTVRAALGTDKAPDMFTWWSGYRMEDIAHWPFGDYMLSTDYDMISDYNRIRHLGFHEFVDTGEM